MAKAFSSSFVWTSCLSGHLAGWVRKLLICSVMVTPLLLSSSASAGSYETERSYYLGGFFSLAAYDTRWDVVTKKADTRRDADAEAATASLVSRGWDIKRYEAKGPIGEIFQLDSQYLLAKKVENGKNIYVLAFRGTQAKLRDWVGTDFDAKAVNFLNTGVSVHKGFLQYTMPAIINPELRALFTKIANDPNAVFIVTGHSLGGAAAVLYSAMLIENYFPASKIQTLTFGQPEAGKDNFINRYLSRMKLTRFVRVGDAVPVAASPMKYRHFGSKLQEWGSLNPIKAHNKADYCDFAVKNSKSYSTVRY